MAALCANSQFLQKNDRTFVLKRKKQAFRNNVTVVREQYLREDIPCYSPRCVKGCVRERDADIGMLPEEATHYVVPSSAVLCPYLELFEQPSVKGMILLQTVVGGVREAGGRRAHQRVKALISEKKRGNVYFANEQCKKTFVPSSSGPVTWEDRLVGEAVCWYADHLGRIPIVYLVQTLEAWLPEVAPHNLKLLTIEQYLQQFHSHLSDQFCSLKASLESGPSDDGEFPEHWTAEEMEQAKEQLVYGMLNVSKRWTSNARIKSSSGPDILIDGLADRNRAIHGDMVAVETMQSSGENDGESNRESGRGRVVGIVERRSTEHVAVFPESEVNSTSSSRGAETVLVIPYDSRVPKIRLSTHLSEQLKNCRILVRLDGWERGSRYPKGHFVCSLGPIGDLETETRTILITHRLLAQPFTKAHLSELPPQDWTVSDQEIAKRKDFRNSHLVFSIDPKGCEDIDDAMSIRVRKNGHLELGVHIADVSHFVEAGSLLDQEAADRGTTVYLVDRRFDMLPSLLSADLCSLWSGRDRAAVSVVWELDAQLQVVKVWYGRSLIRSAYKMTYETAQAVIDGVGLSGLDDLKELKGLDHTTREAKLGELREALLNLTLVAREMKKRRQEGGALELAGAELKMSVSVVDSRTTVEEVAPERTEVETHSTVAECMILANQWVARRIHQAFPSSALLRAHRAPNPDGLSTVQKLVACCGHHMDVSSNKSVAEALDRCSQGAWRVGVAMRMMAVRAMSPAEYFSTGTRPLSQFHHYGLGLDLYTHFTSPIRRYADIVVHRLLLAAVGDSPFTPPPGGMEGVCSHITRQNLLSKAAQTDSSNLFKTMMLKGQPLIRVGGVVTEIKDYGVYVCVLRYDLQGTVPLKNKNGLLAQPGGLDNRDVVFGEGDMVCSESSVTVSHGGGSYGFQLLDVVPVVVRVEESRAHGCSLQLELAGFVALDEEEERGRTPRTAARDPEPGSPGCSERLGSEEKGPRTEGEKTLPSLYDVVCKLQALSLCDTASKPSSIT